MQESASTQPTDNTKLKMSPAARSRMRARETVQYRYYDDGGRQGRGNCTWGIGILVHRGPCTPEELARPVTQEVVEGFFSARVAEAERIVRKRVRRQQLNQEQFDALVSYTYNTGPGGAETALDQVNRGDFKAAASNISRTIYMKVRTKN